MVQGCLFWSGEESSIFPRPKTWELMVELHYGSEGNIEGQYYYRRGEWTGVRGGDPHL